MVHVDDATIEKLGKQLADSSVNLAKRFRILFTLRNVDSDKSVEALALAFDDSSALLKHEVAYVMGQMQRKIAIPILIKVLDNLEENPMVRHEAGEALGAIGDIVALPVLQKHMSDSYREVRETCELAVRRLQWTQEDDKLEDTESNPFYSVDPAPPCKKMSVAECREMMLDESRPMFERYRAMFALRNRNTDESVMALVDGMRDPSALFRHEVAYVLGQMQNPNVVTAMAKVLSTAEENPMVRHEAAETLGSIASEECMEILKKFVEDEERVVRESCVVALDMYEHERSGEFQYADGLTATASE